MPTTKRPHTAHFQIHHLRTPFIHTGELTIEQSQCLCVRGASGAGKTLLLRAIADLDVNEGEIRLDGISRDEMSGPQWRKKVAYLPAESHWWADTVGDHQSCWPMQLLQELGFTEAVLKWRVSRLSSGERQRLALLRLLGNQPSMLLLDEPTANLDQQNTLAVEAVVSNYLRHHPAAAIWVSHDRNQCRRMGSRTANMHNGRIEDENGPPQWN